MTFSVTMPALGESVTEGTVTRWLKNEGDAIAVDEPLLEVSTDKVDTEIPSPVAGILQKIVVPVDSTVAVGAELAVIADGASNNSTPPPAAAPVVAAPVVAAPVVAAPVVAAPVVAAPVVAAPVVAAPVVAAPVAVASNSGTIVTMPALGESVTEGTVTRWLKNVGDQVTVDEALLEVSTDKVDTEIPSPASGTLISIDVAVDSTVPVGARLAVIGGSGAPVVAAPVVAAPVVAAPVVAAPVVAAPVVAAPVVAAPVVAAPVVAAPVVAAPVVAAPVVAAPVVAAPVVAAPVVAAPVVAAPVVAAPVVAAPVRTAPTTVSNEDAYVTPIVRKFASENNVDLSKVTGTGIGGRIRKEDVIAATTKVAAPAFQSPISSAPVAATASAPVAVSPLRGTTVTMSRLRKVIAERMLESLHVSAQLTTVIEVDVTAIARLRDRAKATFEAREGTKLSFLPFFAVAVCEALKQHPVLNASVNGDQITYHGAEHLGIAVDTERGLLVPVIRDAGDLNIGGVARKITDVAARTRDNKISPDELGGGTFTITNTGSRGALFDTPIINQPQVAILGLGAVVKRPMVMKGTDGGETIAVRSMVYLGLSYDHRIVDGADAARFLVTLKERLEGGRFESDLGLS